MTRLILAGALIFILSGCANGPRLMPEALGLEPLPISAMPGWRDDSTHEALAAFLKSCDATLKLADSHVIGEGPAAGQARYWKDACLRGRELPAGDDDLARRYFEQYFVAFKASNNGNAAGLFTGYYEPLLRGSRERTERYRVPLYRLPDEKKEGIPFYERRDIDAGVLEHKGLEIAWVEDPVDAFFLQVQGSGRIALDDGTFLRLGYGGRNDQPYEAIGKVLIARGELKPEGVSMQSIRAWLHAHPDKAREVMEENPSYIFFREVPGDSVLGTLSVPLTPYRSIAVDPRFVPLGVPVFIDAIMPSAGDPAMAIRRSLMVAQDTGSAIRGAVRADIFFGAGPRAEDLAGRMKSGGEYYLLLPKDMVEAKQKNP